MKSRQLLFMLISVISSVSFSADRECRDRLVDFNEQHLGCLSQQIATKSIGNNLLHLTSALFQMDKGPNAGAMRVSKI